jgi:hypothetical protein
MRWPARVNPTGCFSARASPCFCRRPAGGALNCCPPGAVDARQLPCAAPFAFLPGIWGIGADAVKAALCALVSALTASGRCSIQDRGRRRELPINPPVSQPPYRPASIRTLVEPVPSGVLNLSGAAISRLELIACVTRESFRRHVRSHPNSAICDEQNVLLCRRSSAIAVPQRLVYLTGGPESMQ